MMKRLYTHHNSMLVGLIKGRLEHEGFSVTLRNENSSGGAGELAPTDLWPEIWLTNDSDYDRAQEVVAKFNESSEEQMWRCSLCGEDNHSAFEFCWRCNSIPPLDFQKHG